MYPLACPGLCLTDCVYKPAVSESETGTVQRTLRPCTGAHPNYAAQASGKPDPKQSRAVCVLLKVFTALPDYCLLGVSLHNKAKEAEGWFSTVAKEEAWCQWHANHLWCTCISCPTICLSAGLLISNRRSTQIRHVIVTIWSDQTARRNQCIQSSMQMAVTWSCSYLVWLSHLDSRWQFIKSRQLVHRQSESESRPSHTR